MVARTAAPEQVTGAAGGGVWLEPLGREAYNGGCGTLPRGAVVAQRTLDPLALVRIQAGQPVSNLAYGHCAERRSGPVLVERVVECSSQIRYYMAYVREDV